MRFKNLKTGNYVSTENAATIALMEKSPNYEKVAEKKAKGKDKKADKTGEDNAEE